MLPVQVRQRRSVPMNAPSPFKPSQTKNLIGGKWVDSLSGATIAVEDPATEEQIAAVPRSGAEDVDRAVKVARAAFENPAWRKMRPIDRGRLLENIARKLEDH